MQLILDTANTTAIKELNELLTVAGVTTNPTIITKSGKPFETAIQDIIACLAPEQKLFVQAVSTDCDGIVEEAKYIASLKENAYVKIPVTHEGMKAIKKVHAMGIGILATAIYSADQGLMAAMNGADYLAPYVNRMDNYGDGVGQVIDLIQMLKIYDSPTQIIAASFKNTRQVHELMLAGIHCVTIPEDIAYKLIDHPATDIAVDEFTENWQKAYGRNTLR